MLTMLVSVDIHVNDAGVVAIRLLLLSNACADIWIVWVCDRHPEVIGATTRRATCGCTETVAVALAEPDFAVMVTSPGAVVGAHTVGAVSESHVPAQTEPFAPVEVTVAIVVLLLVQVMVAGSTVLPLASFAAATSVTNRPKSTEAVVGVMVIVVAGPTLLLLLPPPQPVTKSAMRSVREEIKTSTARRCIKEECSVGNENPV
jgi:hypothetical protein